MATWYGTPKKFNLERHDPKDYGYGHYEDVEYNWDYNTTSDTLMIKEIDSSGLKTKLYGKWEAEALLHTLAQWYSRYEGVENLNNLLKEFLEEK